MDRLTKQEPNWLNEEFWTSAEEPDMETIDEVYLRLREYENTGLAPEEILDGRMFGGWILCSERLPTKEEYLKNDGRFITTDGNRVAEGLFDVYADGYNEPYWPYQNCQPIAWMPMPEKYQGEDCGDSQSG